jgi:CheY-like chemotaxis protein
LTLEQPVDAGQMLSTEEPTVFVVEDDETNRQLMKDLFESVDLKVELFPSGDAFLAAMPVHGPGCILLDVRMPGISGLDLQARLSQQKLDLPIIIVTAHGDTQMAVRAMKEGAFDFRRKADQQPGPARYGQQGADRKPPHRRRVPRAGIHSEAPRPAHAA